MRVSSFLKSIKRWQPTDGQVPVYDASTGRFSPAAAGGASLIHQASRTITNDETKALPTAYIDITGEPGQDQILIVTLAVPYLHWVVDYSNIAANAIFYLALDNAQTFTTSLFQASSSGVASLLANGDDALSIFANDSAIDPTLGMVARENVFPSNFGKEITLGMFNGANGNLQGGDPGNTLDLSVLFYAWDRALRKFLTTAESGWNEVSRTFG